METLGLAWRGTKDCKYDNGWPLPQVVMTRDKSLNDAQYLTAKPLSFLMYEESIPLAALEELKRLNPHKSAIEKVNTVATLGRVINPVLYIRGVKRTVGMTKCWHKLVLAKTQGANHRHLKQERRTNQ